MNTTIELPIEHVFAAAPDVAGYIHDLTKKRRVPLDKTVKKTMPDQPVRNEAMTNQSFVSTVVISTPTTAIATSANAAATKTFYACPSGRAKVTLDNQLTTYALLDNGSEVIMMPQRVYDHLELPIDTQINWRINGYNEKTTAMLEEAEPIGCCHDVSINVGGVEARLPVFVVRNCNADIILGRPWERAVRATFINEDDGSYTCIIKSQDGRRIVQFRAMTADHERNREYVRHAEEGVIGSDFLKV